jgi:hypothetical protein
VKRSRIMTQGIADRYWQAEARTQETKQLIRDITRDATRAEIQKIKRENARLKTLVAELSLQVHVLKKTAAPDLE